MALQSVRQADVSIGENVVVGLGLLGLLTCSLLKASGCNVIGIDLDPGRVEFAEREGYCSALLRSNEDLTKSIKGRTRSVGADACIITAAAPKSSDPVELAGSFLRPRSRLIIVGNIKATNRNLYQQPKA